MGGHSRNMKQQVHFAFHVNNHSHLVAVVSASAVTSAAFQEQEQTQNSHQPTFTNRYVL